MMFKNTIKWMSAIILVRLKKYILRGHVSVVYTVFKLGIVAVNRM
jgi:hypothetical protein